MGSTGCSPCRNAFRHLLLTLGFFCLTSVNSNYIIINFTFICMARPLMSDDMSPAGNDTSTVLDYKPSEKSAILWAVAIGTIAGTFPVNYFYTKYGARWPFFIAGMMSAISTALMPLAAFYHLYLLLFLRLVQGLAYAANFGAIGTLCVRWAPLAEVSIFISVLTSFTPVSAVVTNPLSGWLCNTRMGWPGAYYTHAAFCFIVFILWIALYKDDPQNHPSVSEKELAKIHKDKTRAHIERDSFVPYRQLLSNKVIWIVWFNAFVEMVAVTLLLTYAPLYFHKILGYDIGLTGTLVSLSSIIHLPIKFVGGIISDRLTSVSEKHRMWFFNTMAVGLAGVCTALVGIFPASWPAMGVAMFASVITLMGLNTGGFYKCGTLSARQYAHVVLTVIQFMKCVALFVAPATVAMFVSKEDEYDQWRYVYWLHGFFLVLANCMFYPIATDKPASFTKITRAGKEDEEAAEKLQNGNVEGMELNDAS
ncbi:unnamed protein product [Cylicocyclus nassatus]|uniref:Major facilitator superfamily (MFS) profile domain-containing protein n=1 Tax=Cylicocyclus nassatus TaxID=53992 RepID=A0AA36HD57_CYLNA|nr:unnamed protein product [Cylicocyclus nassatus]